MTNAEIAAELVRLKHLSDITADGTPDGHSETEAALFDFFLDRFDEIVAALRRAA